MKEILFKAKRRDNHEWVYGDLLHDWQDLGDCIRQNAQYGKGGIYPIDANTIGQYAGKKDKNGEKVFEGDRIRYYASIREQDFTDGTVCFGDIPNGGVKGGHVGFYIKLDRCEHNVHWRKDLIYWLENAGVEIIGNMNDKEDAE